MRKVYLIYKITQDSETLDSVWSTEAKMAGRDRQMTIEFPDAGQRVEVRNVNSIVPETDTGEIEDGPTEEDSDDRI